MPKPECVTCQCGYPRAVGFACTACPAFDFLPSYHAEHTCTVTAYGAAVDAITDAGIQAWESDGGAVL
jgi:hypothetical protein